MTAGFRVFGICDLRHVADLATLWVRAFYLTIHGVGCDRDGRTGV